MEFNYQVIYSLKSLAFYNQPREGAESGVKKGLRTAGRKLVGVMDRSTESVRRDKMTIEVAKLCGDLLDRIDAGYNS